MNLERIRNTIDRPIVLIGLMGAGKTTVGHRLARRLGLPFVDSDIEVERAAGRSIREIFEDFGEEALRSGERRVIQRLMDGEPKVLATGGGSFDDSETRALILERGIAVWLRADLDSLVERTSRRNTRPALDGEEPREVLETLIDEKHPIFEQAQIAVQTGNGPHSAVVNDILEGLAEFLDIDDKDFDY